MRLASARSNHPAHDTQSTVTAAAASGLEALQPIALLQISMLRMWAHSLERFAANYEKALDETRREARRTRASVTHAQDQEHQPQGAEAGALGGQPLENQSKGHVERQHRAAASRYNKS
jgi:hypothetical protein